MNKTLKKLLIHTKKMVFSQQLGNNTSKIKGEGYDFVELREYEQGEDIRKIDWVISAKMHKPYVKVFHTQRQLDIHIVPILTGSTHFGTVKLKQHLIAEICSILGYVAAAQGDSYSSFIANETVIRNSKKTNKLFGVEKMVPPIFEYQSLHKKANYQHICESLHQQINKKSLIFLIGDFFEVTNFPLKLLSKKHEVIVIITRDRFEENPAALGAMHFTDPTHGTLFEGDLSSSLVKNYSTKISKQDQKLFEHLKKSGVSFIKIYTHDNAIQKMAQLFS